MQRSFQAPANNKRNIHKINLRYIASTYLFLPEASINLHPMCVCVFFLFAYCVTKPSDNSAARKLPGNLLTPQSWMRTLPGFVEELFRLKCLL